MKLIVGFLKRSKKDNKPLYKEKKEKNNKNQKLKRRHYNLCHRNIKDYKRYCE